MASIDELQKKRFQFLHRLHQKTGGNKRKTVDELEFGNELGFDKMETEIISQYLVGEDLIKYIARRAIAITHQGIIEVEAALSHPEKPTQYFPPANIINIHNMQNSQIQQGTTQSIQSKPERSKKQAVKRGLVVLVGLIGTLGAIYGLSIRGCQTDRSYRKAVLQELQNGRDSLAYTLVCRKRNWRRPARFKLMYMDKVPELFTDESKLRSEVQRLYGSLDGGMAQAAELRDLLSQKNAVPATIENIVKAINKIVDFADEVGPKVAKFVGDTWEKPPAGMTLEELTRYYEGVVLSASTDAMVIYK